MATQLVYEQKGRTWIVRYAQTARWPLYLIARNVYHGTGRLLTDLTLARTIEGGPKSYDISILTAHVDLLTITRRTGFSKECASRLSDSFEGGANVVEKAVGAMIDGLQERLLQDRGSIEIHSATEKDPPGDLAPPYVVWPLVPKSRPGMLIAPSGTGKSHFALLAGLSVVVGKALLPRVEPRSEGPVLYVGQEEDYDQWLNRVEMMCRGHQVKRPSEYWYTRLNAGSLPDSVDRLAEAAAVKKAQLVIVDSAQATWGTEGEGSVRGYATQWFNALAEIGVPVLIIEHPNLANTMKNNSSQAAGAGVKQDRVGHQWGMRSIALPVRDNQPFRYHVTLSDTKRNYVAQQPEINYELMIFHHDWMRFVESEALTPELVVEEGRGAHMRDAIASVMREPDDLHEDGCWSIEELVSRLDLKDGRRVREHLKSDEWSAAKWSAGNVFQFELARGTGNRGDPLMYRIVTKPGEIVDPVQLSMAPGDPDEPS